MRTIPVTTAAALALAFAGAAGAQPAPMKGMAMGASTATKTGSGVGVIKAVDPKAGTVTIQHGPIPAVGWPAMTMAFKAAPPSLLKTAKVGRKVAFVARVTGAKAEVTSLRPN